MMKKDISRVVFQASNRPKLKYVICILHTFKRDHQTTSSNLIVVPEVRLAHGCTTSSFNCFSHLLLLLLMLLLWHTNGKSRGFQKLRLFIQTTPSKNGTKWGQPTPI